LAIADSEALLQADPPLELKQKTDSLCLLKLELLIYALACVA
jgi:hypothetical protein